MTAADVIKRALRLAQVFAQGEDPSGTDEETDALAVLNSMLASWSAEKLLVPYLVTDTLTLTASDGEYTFGSGGDINSARPLRIEHAYVRDSGGNDYPIKVINPEDYNNITLKTTTGRPCQLYLILEYPLAKIKLYYVPDAAETLYLDSWKPLSSLATAATTISLSGEYQKAIEFNLAIELAAEYNQTVQPFVYAEAERTKSLIKTMNQQPVPTRNVDPAFFNYRKMGRNIYNDGEN